jgi:hypothetical protein
VNQPVQPKSATLSATTPVFTASFVAPQYADVGIRLRPPTYPSNAVINCTPYQVVFKNGGTVVTTVNPPANAANSLGECTFGSGPSVPAGVALTMEVKKNGVVGVTQAAGPFTAKQHYELVVQPMP